jgi:broad specificity phosphatase PhoE
MQRAIWAGWKDAPLSNHGTYATGADFSALLIVSDRNERTRLTIIYIRPRTYHAYTQQAKACGESFSTIPLTTIYASPLNRAHTTAQAILTAQPAPQPPFIVSPDLREQHFGLAEGEPWTYDPSAQVDVERKIFPVLHGRDEQYPQGESLNDLALRATRAIDDLVMPWVYSPDNYGKPGGAVHLAVVSHGLCISEVRSCSPPCDLDAPSHPANTACFCTREQGCGWVRTRYRL